MKKGLDAGEEQKVAWKSRCRRVGAETHCLLGTWVSSFGYKVTTSEWRWLWKADVISFQWRCERRGGQIPPGRPGSKARGAFRGLSLLLRSQSSLLKIASRTIKRKPRIRVLSEKRALPSNPGFSPFPGWLQRSSRYPQEWLESSSAAPRNSLWGQAIFQGPW